MLKNIIIFLIYFVVFVFGMTLFKRFDLFGFSKRSTLSIILEGAITGMAFSIIISYYTRNKVRKSKEKINTTL